MADFNPQSPDAMFATVLERLNELKTTSERIESAVNKTNGRVTALERDKWYQRGIMAVVSVSAVAAWQWFTGK